MAGIQALANQYSGSNQGLPNSTYYSIAKTEYGASGSSSCNSSKGNAVGSSCIFYDVTQGDMDLPCTGTNNCYKPSGTYGVLSTSNTAYQPAYGTQSGWDFASGIGTVNAYNLVKAFGSPVSTPTATADGDAYRDSKRDADCDRHGRHSNCDCDCDGVENCDCECNLHADGNRDGRHSNCDCNCDCNSYRDGNSHADGNADCYADSNLRKADVQSRFAGIRT